MNSGRLVQRRRHRLGWALWSSDWWMEAGRSHVEAPMRRGSGGPQRFTLRRRRPWWPILLEQYRTIRSTDQSGALFFHPYVTNFLSSRWRNGQWQRNDQKQIQIDLAIGWILPTRGKQFVALFRSRHISKPVSLFYCHWNFYIASVVFGSGTYLHLPDQCGRGRLGRLSLCSGWTGWRILFELRRKVSAVQLKWKVKKCTKRVCSRCTIHIVAGNFCLDIYSIQIGNNKIIKTKILTLSK